MDGDSTDVVRQHLHLAGVNADAKLDPQVSHRVTHRHGGAHGAARRFRTSRGSHPPWCSPPCPRKRSSCARMRRLCSASTCFQAASPSLAAVRVESTMSDMQQGRHEAFVLARHAERADIAEHVHDDDGLIPDDPDVMPGRDVHDVARPELGGLAIVHLDVEATLQHELEVVDLARRRALDRLQGCRPAESGLEDAATDGQGARRAPA